MALSDDIEKIIDGEVYTDEKTRRTFSRDTSLFEVMPSLVVAPKDARDLSALVRYANEHTGTTLTARSGGTGMDGGALSEGIVLDFTKHFTKIIGFTKDTATLEPGVYYHDFEKEAAKRNLLMPSYPASKEICAVGGMVANNAGGELTLSYGKVARYVRELSVVLSDGNEYVLGSLSADELQKKTLTMDFEGDLYRKMYKLVAENKETINRFRPKVSKNSAGYALWDIYDEKKKTFDLTKLFVGSQGTLGLVTKITFDLIHPPKHSQMVVLFLDSFDRLGELVDVVLSHRPTTFESYDDKTLSLAVRFFGGLVRRLGLLKTFLIGFRSLGPAFSILTRGFPKLVLQITFDGDDPQVLRRRAYTCAAACRKFNPRLVRLTKSGAEVDEYWLIRRESFNLLRTKVKGKKTAPFIDDIVVPTGVLPEFLPKLYTILDEYKDVLEANIAGHIGNGNFHIIPLMNLSNPKAREAIPVIAKRVYDLVFSYGGSATGEHNDGIIRTPFVRQQFGDEMYRLFEETKKIFDPKNIFNPGKKVHGTMEYAVSHIAK